MRDEFLRGGRRIRFDRQRSIIERSGLPAVALRREYEQSLLAPVAEDDVVVDVLALEDCSICLADGIPIRR